MLYDRNYDSYRVEDFVLDPCFRDWALNRGTAQVIFWQLWITHHPERYQDIQEARMILYILHPAFMPEKEIRKELRWQEICN